MASHVLAPSNAFRAQHTSLFDFVYPAAVALWNLRWQVRGYLETRPNATEPELFQRFVAGSGFHHKNMRIVCIDRTWSEQLDEFARVVLINLVALYEGWTDIVAKLFPGVNHASEWLQFPSTGLGGRKKGGIGQALAPMTINKSPDMEAAFTDSLRTGPRYSLNHLDDMLLIYRYFKEVRNAFMHTNGVAESRIEDAYRHAATTGDMGIGKTLSAELNPIVAGAVVRPSLSTVVSFSEVLLRIVTTVDAELAATAVAQSYFVTQWPAKYTNQLVKKMLPSSRDKRDARIANRSVALGFPRPGSREKIDQLLKAEGLIV